VSSVGRDLQLVGKQVKYEQLSFWRNPFGAVFTVGFSVVFLVLLAASGGTARSATLGGLRQIQYLVPGFAAYGVMAASFNMLTISIVGRRETGLLKRLRLSPLPAWVMVASLFVSTFLVGAVQVVLLLGVGRIAFNVSLPHNWLAFAVAIVVGSVCFTSIGLAASTIVPNQDAAGPMVSIVFFVLLFLSGLWFPLKPGSGLAKVANYFPVRHMILATFAPFDLIHGASPWAWHDILVMAIWGVVASYVAVRRFAWSPRRG
jgi:ABC-2 type transport system permease protein